MDIVLERNGFQLVLIPDLGGSIRSFTLNGQNVLLPASEQKPPNPLKTAGFPLFPFSGRIRNAKFSWNDRAVQLEGNFPPEPHAIHGQAWLASWTVDSVTADQALLSFDYQPGDWPWPYRAIQHFELMDDGLKLTLTLENLSAEEMPAGLGWHPYFPRGDAELSANVSSIWVADHGEIPNRQAELGKGTDIRVAQRVDALCLDNAFVAQPANADIVWPSSGLHVSIRSTRVLGHLVVYVPEGMDFFCVEPVSHAPDAINSPQEWNDRGLSKLAPGEVLTACVFLKVSSQVQPN
jgi:aldose 1-epimerase